MNYELWVKEPSYELRVTRAKKQKNREGESREIELRDSRSRTELCDSSNEKKQI